VGLLASQREKGEVRAGASWAACWTERGEPVGCGLVSRGFSPFLFFFFSDFFFFQDIFQKSFEAKQLK